MIQIHNNILIFIQLNLTLSLVYLLSVSSRNRLVSRLQFMHWRNFRGESKFHPWVLVSALSCFTKSAPCRSGIRVDAVRFSLRLHPLCFLILPSCSRAPPAGLERSHRSDRFTQRFARVSHLVWKWIWWWNICFYVLQWFFLCLHHNLSFCPMFRPEFVNFPPFPSIPAAVCTNWGARGSLYRVWPLFDHWK